MTSKELHRLRRRELLQLLLSLSEETEETRKTLEETSAQLELTASNYERLRKRLDMKDAQIAELRATIESERKKREIELEEAGSIAMAALKLNGVFEAAQKAADQYVYNMKKRAEDGEKAGETGPDNGKPEAEQESQEPKDRPQADRAAPAPEKKRKPAGEKNSLHPAKAEKREEAL